VVLTNRETLTLHTVNYIKLSIVMQLC